MIAIVDTGGANIASVRNALERLGVKSRLTADPKEIEAADQVILPGVGEARSSMERLREKNLINCVRDLKQPVLGICLGMQLLFEGSEEGDTACLGLLPGAVKRLKSVPNYSIPHMGWNQVELAQENELTRDISSGEYFYFVHSYCAPGGEWVTGTCDYSERFPAMVRHKNFFGVQFHPERSAAAGAKLLRNFVSL
jgi:imidazole glycerol-phosphate synthase subunit HisH